MNGLRFIADFDSASAMLRATAAALRQQDISLFPGSKPVRAMLPLVNLLPIPLRQQVYKYGGWLEAAPAKQVEQFDADAAAQAIVDHYPNRQYPAAMIGSSSGPGVHLCAALGIPWLPQTLLLPVRQSGVHPDDMQSGMETGRAAGQRLLERNPQLQLHHMHDASQDRLMIQKMTYFRVKYRRLSEAYRRFLERSLAPGATLFIVECTLEWPTTRIAERHYFQPGALGGLTVDEILHGSERLAEFLARNGSSRRRWEPPAPDAERPEAEWGFEPELRDDLRQLAARRGYRIRRIVFNHPQDLSPLVAELYRWWYRRRGLPDNRLLVESFIELAPVAVLKKALIPYWTFFAVQPAADRLEQYLAHSTPFREINMMLFSHGVESAGLASIDTWRSLLARATDRGRFIGVDERRFPRDFGSLSRYHSQLRKLPDIAQPSLLTLEELDSFLSDSKERYEVKWLLEQERHSPRLNTS